MSAAVLLTCLATFLTIIFTMEQPDTAPGVQPVLFGCGNIGLLCVLPFFCAFYDYSLGTSALQSSAHNITGRGVLFLPMSVIFQEKSTH